MTNYSKRFKSIASGLTILALCTFAIAIISIFLMDVLVYPITKFAINNTKLYTDILLTTLLVLFIIGIIYFLIKKVITLYSNGNSVPAILARTGKSILFYIGVLFVFIAISAVVVTVLYTATKTNHTVIYKLNK